METTGEEITFNGKTYTQIFYDDFDGDKLDPKKWDKAPEWERQAHMKEHGWWSNSCTSVKNGNLVLEAKKQGGRTIAGAVRTKKADYSKTMFENTYGLYEIKFKVEEGSGFWYAFWMMADNDEAHISGTAENGAEIDCFEILPGPSDWTYDGKAVKDPGRMMSTIHWDAYGKDHKMKGTDGIKVTDFDPDFWNNWHTFQFEWNEDCYECYLDGRHLYTLDSSYGNGICKAKAYMKISVEFGDWDGPVCQEILDGGSKKMLVDYVKVYKAK